MQTIKLQTIVSIVLKIESDYSQSDLGQLRTRIEAMLETRRPAAVA